MVRARMREVYCDRQADVAIAHPDGKHGTCAECGALVTTAPAPDVSLICVPCLIL